MGETSRDQKDTVKYAIIISPWRLSDWLVIMLYSPMLQLYMQNTYWRNE